MRLTEKEWIQEVPIEENTEVVFLERVQEESVVLTVEGGVS